MRVVDRWNVRIRDVDTPADGGRVDECGELGGRGPGRGQGTLAAPGVSVALIAQSVAALLPS